MAQVLFLSPPRRHDGSRALFNNASLSLASYLARRGVEARLEPLVGSRWRDDLQDALIEHRPGFTAISCKWWDTLYGATELARLVREFRPGTRTVAGGQTASAFADDLVAGGHFDAVVCGDGEKPLLDHVLGHPEGNLTYQRDGQVVRLPLNYVQPRGGTEDLTLLDDLTAIADERFLGYVGYNAPFVWTGKGCQSTCLYCGGSALGHKTLFSRTGYAYRPIEQTLRDIETISRWSGDTVMFDFDPVTDPGRRAYYRELMAQLPPRRYHAAFYCWSLPDPEFIEEVARTFRSAIVGIDAQTYSEPLRERLAKTAWIKPFSGDEAIEAAVAACARLPNCAVAMYGIVGLATETPFDVERAASWVDRLLDLHGEAFYELEVTPLSIEPGSLVARDPARYGMVALRRTFSDYLEFTRLQYGSGAGFHEAPFAPGRPHPFGIHQIPDAPDRVWHDYRALQARIAARTDELSNQQAHDSLRIEDDRVSLRLRNRTVYQDVWRLVLWASHEALSRGLALVQVDATRAHINVPSGATLRFDERYAWAIERLEALGQAIAAGRLRVEVTAGPAQRWGALAEAGINVADRGSC